MNPNQDNIIYQSDNLVNQGYQHLIQEKLIDARGGCCVLWILLLMFVLLGACIGIFVSFLPVLSIVFGVLLGLYLIIFIFLATGFCTIEINEARVLTLFGKYYGTVKKNGFLWINPFVVKRTVSLKAQNLNGAVIKVNDKHGNPVMMGCVVVWKINDTAKAIFEVENTYEYIRVQSEGVVREIGTLFPYDKLSEEDTITLKGDQKEINRILVDLMAKIK